MISTNKITNSKIDNLKNLSIPLNWELEIKRIIDENSMLYEPWMQTATDYQELKQKLKIKGYSNIPSGEIPLLKNDGYGSLPIADTSSVKMKMSMLRKKK